MLQGLQPHIQRYGEELYIILDPEEAKPLEKEVRESEYLRASEVWLEKVLERR